MSGCLENINLKNRVNIVKFLKMTNSYSKFKIFNSINHNCYESIHPWDPSCSGVFLLFFFESLKGGTKIYLPIFLIPQLLSIRWTHRRSKETRVNKSKFSDNNNNNDDEEAKERDQEQLKEEEDLVTEILSRVKRAGVKILISSSVLAANTSLVIGLTCMQNHATGKIFYLSPFYSSFVSHWISFKYETSSRRNGLAMFAIKSSFEIIHRMLLHNSPFLRQNFNEDLAAVFLFASSLAVNFYLLNSSSFSDSFNARDPLKQLLSSFVIGSQRRKRSKRESNEILSETETKREESSLSYVLKGCLKMLTIGWMIQTSLNLFKARRLKSQQKSFSDFMMNLLLDSSSLKFPLFLSSLVGVYRSVSCFLRQTTGKESDAVNEAIAGFSGGFLSMWTFYPSTQISLYTFWKTMFTMYFMKFGRYKYAQTTLDGFFFLADSFLINCMVMEPYFVAKNYLNFIDSITGKYLTKFNIISHYLLTDRLNPERYGTEIPTLQAEYLSKRYLESAGSWLLDVKK